ncbi:MAG: hypothetical protein JWN02_965 [Acidobacteria bacterium]|nr:hypothetical protein [Acidobacteriota bacterium]
MRPNSRSERCCSYVVALERTAASHDELRPFAEYLSFLDVAGCDVVILDSSPQRIFEENRRILRWVGRHVAVIGANDPVRLAVEHAACEKVILATEDVRYGQAELGALTALLDEHEVIEPQDYLQPLPWWGAIEAGRMLVHRGIEPLPDRGATFGVRRSAVRGLRPTLDAFNAGSDPVRRLAVQGADVRSADLFVRRQPPPLRQWIGARARQAGDDFALPVKSAFFFALLPMALLMALMGGAPLVLAYAGALILASVLLALRGRQGAASFFPLRACLFAPLWLLERALSVYGALALRLRTAAAEPAGVPVAERSGADRVASGE